MKLHHYIFYILLFLLPFQTRTLFNPETAYVSWYFNYHLAYFLYLTDLVYIVGIVSWIISGGVKLASFHENRLLWPIIGIFLMCLISLLHVKQLGLGLYGAFKWFQVLSIILYMVSEWKNELYHYIGARIVLLSAVIQSLLAWFQFHMQRMVGLKLLGEYIAPLGTPGLANIETASGKIIRAYGTMPHPNILGAFLVFGLALGLYLVSHETSFRKHLFAEVGLMLVLIGIFTTFSRTAWLAALVLCFCFFVFNWFRNRKNAGTVIFIMLVSGLIILGLYRQDLRARVADSNTNTVSIEDRFFFNHLGIELIKKSPIIGVGVGNYVPELIRSNNLEPWQYQPAHNIYIYIAAELGIVGLGLFIWLVMEIFKKNWLKNILTHPLLFTYFLLLITFLMMGLFDHYFVTIQQGRLMFAFALGMIAAIPEIYDHQKIR